MPGYRIEYAKTDNAKFLSHLELIRTIIRALRRSGLPLVFTQGFNPHPKMSFGPSLGVGVAGLREYLDIELASIIPLREGLASLRRQSPPGLKISGLMSLQPAAPGIGKMINCAWCRLALSPEQAAADWQQALDQLAGASLPLYYERPKDGKQFDVRSGLLAYRLAPEQEGAAIDLLISIGDSAPPLRGLVTVLLSLAGACGCFDPARTTRVALLRRNGGLVNPLGEEKQLWEQ